MVDSDYRKAMRELSMGRVPSNLRELANHAYRGLVDAMLFLNSATECVERMQNDISVLRERMEKCSKN